jgi:hypothetical protein
MMVQALHQTFQKACTRVEQRTPYRRLSVSVRHPGAFRHSRAGGNPGRSKAEALGPRLRGDDGRSDWVLACAGMTLYSFCDCMKRSKVASVKRNQRFWSARNLE